MSKGENDIYTFQYAELKQGKSYALAMAEVTDNFVQSNFQKAPRYQALLLSILQNLSEDSSMTDALLQTLETALCERKNALLQEERENDKTRRKFDFTSLAKGTDVNEDSDEEVEELTEEEKAKRKAEEEELEKKKEEDYIRAQERYESLLRQKEENAERLRMQARKVDVKAFEAKLKSAGAVLLNKGTVTQKKKGKQNQLTPEVAAQLKSDVALIMKEIERLNAVMRMSDEEIPAALEEGKKALAENQAKSSDLDNAPALSAEVTKAEIAQLQQKLAKQTLEKNRVALQVKAMEPNPLRDELLSVLEQRDALSVKLGC